MWMRGSQEPISGINLKPVMFMQRKNAKTVLQSFIAAGDAQPIPIISTGISMTPMIWAVNCKENALNVRL